MIEAIFFDFNGVIIDDERIQMTAYQNVLIPYGIELTEEDYFSALGMDDATFVRTSFSRAGKQVSDEISRAVLSAKTSVHRSLIENDLPLFPGVVTFLKATSRHWALGLVSMANDEEIGYVMDRSGLGPLFTVIVSADKVHVCKPAADCYQQALKELNEKRSELRLLPLLPKECLAIEDSPPGIQSAASAGMHTLGITNTVSEHELRAAGAEVVTASLADWNPSTIRLVF